MSERPDQHPAFWNAYSEPRTAVTALVQRPLYQIDGYALCNAVMTDFRRDRSKAKVLDMRRIAEDALEGK